MDLTEWQPCVKIERAELKENLMHLTILWFLRIFAPEFDVSKSDMKGIITGIFKVFKNFENCFH